MELDFNKIFKIPNRAMRINRCHPNIKKDKKWLFYFLLAYSFCLLVLLNFIYNILLNINKKDFINTIKNVLFATVCIGATYQYVVVVWKRNSLKFLIESVKKDFIIARFLKFDERKIMYKYAKKSTNLSRMWLLIWLATFTVFPSKHFYILGYYYVKGTPRFVPALDIDYPGIIEEYKENPYIYPFIYILQVCYALFATSMYVAFTPLGPCFMLHACAQLEIVERKLYGLFQNDKNVVDETLKEVVKQMQNIYRFVDHIQETFKIAYEITLRVHSIVLPVAAFEMLEAMKQGEVPVEFITFVLGSMLMCATLCYYSEQLIERSESFRLAVYSCGWQTVFDRSSRATILLVLTRAHKPIALRTLFRTITLEYLADLTRQAYTIFNLMNAMWK